MQGIYVQSGYQYSILFIRQMIQTSKDARLLHLITSAISSACGNPEDPVTYAKQDMPLTVRLDVTKDGFQIIDEYHSIPCEFSKGALFWFLMYNPTTKIKDLKDRYIVVNEYAPGSLLTDKKEVKVCLKIYSFTLLDKEEAKDIKFPTKASKEVIKDETMEPFLEMLRKAHLRRALLKKDINELPNLEDLLAGGKSSTKKSAIPPVPDVKVGKDESKEAKEEDKIIDFADIDEVEKKLREDVEVLSIEEGEKKKGIAAGSEGNLDRKELLEQCIKKVKDKHLVELLKDRGMLNPGRTPSKISPKKKGKMPEDLKEAVDKVLEEGGHKRKKAEGKKPKAAKAEKKVAVEEEGKKVSATKSKKEGYTLRSKEGKKKGGK